MDKPECSICDNIFDSNDHRPRVLPCGHGFCSMCIEKSIHRGDKTCAICRKEHGASSSTDLPVSFLLEEFAHKLAVSDSQKNGSDLVQESNYGMCPKHKEIPLYFLCKSHSIKVCHSCAVIDHPPSSCHLITFEEEIKERKKSQIEAYKNQSKMLTDTEKELSALHKNNCNKVVILFNKIVQLNKENEQITDSIKVCKEKQESLILLENELSATTSNQGIAIQCEMGNTRVLQSHRWEEALKKELNMKQLYAQVERIGRKLSCKALDENGRVFIPCLSAKVKPPSSAIIIKEAELGLNSSTTTVFMDISEGGHSLGRLIINIFGETYHGQYFIRRVLGIDGISLKGTNFAKRNIHFVALENYMSDDGFKGKLAYTSSTDYSKSIVPLRGMLFPESFHGGSFSIWNGNQGGTRSGHFGTLVSGMNVIDTIASHSIGETEIIVFDCGIILNS